MSKVRVHQLAKELGIEPKEFIARLEKSGVRGKRAQSFLDEEEVATIRGALAGAEKPQVVVGEEKVVADRMVREEDVNLGGIQAHEKVVERRVRTNVIRRRTSRTEVVASPAPQETEVQKGPAEEQPPEASPPPVTAPSEETSPTISAEEEIPTPKVGAVEPAAVPSAEEIMEAVEPQEGKSVRVEEEALRGPKVLGRIDLKRTAPTPVAKEAPPRKPQVDVQPQEPIVEPLKGERVSRKQEDEKQGDAGVQQEKPAKGVRHKKRVVKKEAVLETREREFRSGRFPRKKRALPGREQRKTEITMPKASKRIIKFSEVVSVGDLAKGMGVKAGEVIKKLMALGMMATINQMLDMDTATLVGAEFDYQVENAAVDMEIAIEDEHGAEEADVALDARPPVVTIMGHVDHGKTSLLDAVRSANVTDQEAGGITQHIGAYHVNVNGKMVTFLDTPGHEAFTAMRARGAKVTDIVVLVVAADDGVMPQTVEAINHARAAGVPIVVAINKIDMPDANMERVKRGLSEHGLLSEDWGGDTIFVPVSARTKEGIPQLLEMLLLQADVLELKANPKKLAKGAVIEAKLDRGRGPVATVLVQEGTLRVGDPVVCGVLHGKIRAMIDDQGRRVEEALPALPVEILGFQGVPQSGESFLALSDETKARQIAEHRYNKQREADLAQSVKVSLEDFYEQIKTGETKELRIVLKTDVHGSVEALTDALARLSTDEVRLVVIHGSVGGVTERDVLLASASNAIIIGFNIRPEAKAGNLAVQEGVEVRLYTVIYEAVTEIKAAMEGLLEPTFRDQTHGQVQIREVFNIRGAGSVAGCYVSDGKIQRSSLIRLLRDQVVVHEGKLASLRRIKDDVREVTAGYECGLAIEGFQDIKVGDVVEAYEQVPVTRRLTSARSTSEASQASATDH